jgi:hypothetical protein
VGNEWLQAAYYACFAGGHEKTVCRIVHPADLQAPGLPRVAGLKSPNARKPDS